ncbi:MAG: ATP-dependent 6-phosphofructokinase [Bdellovibrionales bacterium]|nr:ATP-dependent 6-phosphofructokinase [Bdellovibrionales bacterium]MBT3525168.1 ATP-dependent 6-phosphofructokinase [Bdellovibrionales bacterium]MBT7669494.1 ATP-dependent 6-phosphofructokinase [Bdellovibrionales bacterium]MBT7766080.1 ATP-dependent 6-phosphofructokinase [Bdellovibrionales bacterium]
MHYQDRILKELTQKDFEVDHLGEEKFDSPVPLTSYNKEQMDRRVLFNNFVQLNNKLPAKDILSFERPAPKSKIFFDSSKINVGIVTCGGLCPGLNDVIRSLCYSCLDTYNVKNVYGFRYGYQGLTNEFNHTAIRLDASTVDIIHEHGGTILGSSRGEQSIEDMVDTLVKFNISILFVIGGDGTHHGSARMVKEVTKRKLAISIIGVPKTIDNDIAFIFQTFGFNTAVEEARRAIDVAHVEAKGAKGGIGMVKLMGRHAGHIAANATLASGNSNICLIPEEPFTLDSLFSRIEKRLRNKDHLVLVVAEGAGQDLLVKKKGKEKFDKSGNLKLLDIGTFLKNEINSFLNKKGIEHTIKYIDPSYMIRSTPASAADSSFCLRLGSYATHAGMSGRTNCLIGHWNHHFTLVPLSLALGQDKRVDIQGALWQSVREITIRED